jgi:hypothetical protein
VGHREVAAPLTGQREAPLGERPRRGGLALPGQQPRQAPQHAGRLARVGRPIGQRQGLLQERARRGVVAAEHGEVVTQLGSPVDDAENAEEVAARVPGVREVVEELSVAEG